MYVIKSLDVYLFTFMSAQCWMPASLWPKEHCGVFMVLTVIYRFCLSSLTLCRNKKQNKTVFQKCSDTKPHSNPAEVMQVFLLKDTLHVFFFKKDIQSSGSQTFQPGTPQNNDTRDWGPPLTLEVVHNVTHSHAHTL